MTKLHEYQAKALFRAYGVPVPESFVANTPAEALEAASRLSSGKAVVKAQIQAGGRVNAGGVKLVDTPREAADFAESILGTNLVTEQSDDEGLLVNSVLVEELCDIAKELYLGIVIDRDRGCLLITTSADAGVDTEGVPLEPTRLKLSVDLYTGSAMIADQGQKLAEDLKLQEPQGEQFKLLLAGLCRLLREKELHRIKVDPLVITDQGDLMCLDVNVETGAAATDPSAGQVARTLASY